MRLALILFLVLVSSAAYAQQQSPEQLYRQINAALAQENARLGAEKEQLQPLVKHLTDQLTAAQARVKELESKQEEKK